MQLIKTYSCIINSSCICVAGGTCSVCVSERKRERESLCVSSRLRARTHSATTAPNPNTIHHDKLTSNWSNSICASSTRHAVSRAYASMLQATRVGGGGVEICRRKGVGGVLRGACLRRMTSRLQRRKRPPPPRTCLPTALLGYAAREAISHGKMKQVLPAGHEVHSVSPVAAYSPRPQHTEAPA